MVGLTGAIAVFAGLQLLIFLAQLWTSYAQLRAYVFIEDAKITAPIKATTWSAVYTVKNAGATPAHKVRVVDSLTVEKWRPEKLPIPTDEDYFGSMAPGGDFIDAEPSELTATPLQNGAVTHKEDPTEAIFLVGQISYRDVFRRKHTTDFCFYWQGPIGDTPEQMSAYDKGNDST